MKTTSKKRRFVSLIITVMMIAAFMLQTVQAGEVSIAPAATKDVSVAGSGCYTPWKPYNAKRDCLRRQYGSGFYFVLDIDRNGVSEMVYGYKKGGKLRTSIYAYKSNKVVMIKGWSDGISGYYTLSRNPGYLVEACKVSFGHYKYYMYRMNTSRTKLIKVGVYDINTLRRKFYLNGKRCTTKTATTFIRALVCISWKR